MYHSLDIAASGMTAMKQMLDITANNISNINTTRTENGEPYHRQAAILKEKNEFDDLFNNYMGSGVKVDQIVTDSSERLVYDPSHPDAGVDGNVRYPEIDITAELTNMIEFQRSYDANVTTLNAIKKVMEKQEEIGRV